jgi:hypothetical protein
MGDSFYHIFATIYLPFVWTRMTRNFSSVIKLLKNDVCDVTIKTGYCSAPSDIFDVKILSVINNVFVMSDIHGIKE